jgi:hypothetical protein
MAPRTSFQCLAPHHGVFLFPKDLYFLIGMEVYSKMAPACEIQKFFELLEAARFLQESIKTRNYVIWQKPSCNNLGQSQQPSRWWGSRPVKLK